MIVWRSLKDRKVNPLLQFERSERNVYFIIFGFVCFLGFGDHHGCVVPLDFHRLGDVRFLLHLVQVMRMFQCLGLLWREPGALVTVGLDQRIEGTSYEVEFQRLIRMYNEMMGRLEKAFYQATRFSADASHELKIPLARLQAELEAALKNAPHESSDQRVYSSLLDEMGRLKGITEKLLLLSTSDTGKLKLTLEPVNLSEILQNVVEDCEARTEDRAIDPKIPEGVEVEADAILLEQAIQNLATNAIRYSDRESKITFSLDVNGEQVFIRVENSGTPISESDQDRIFECFYRVDAARSSRKDGVALGLSLSREIVRARRRTVS